MDELTVSIYDIETGENIVRPMTSDEIEQYEADKLAAETRAAERLAKETARQSAIDKLKALGLSDDEIRAISG